MDKNQLKEFMNAIGMIGETALIFYRSVVEAGGSQEEAMRLTQALIAATLFGGGKKDTPRLTNREEQNKHERRNANQHRWRPEWAVLHRAA